MRRSIALAAGLSLALLSVNGCTPAYRINPQDAAVVLLPDNSTEPATDHFDRTDTMVYWFWDYWRGEGTMLRATDVLAKAAPNQAIKGARLTIHPNGWAPWLKWGLFAAAVIGGSAVGPSQPAVGTAAAALAVADVLIFPDIFDYEVEGDITAIPAYLTKSAAPAPAAAPGSAPAIAPASGTK